MTPRFLIFPHLIGYVSFNKYALPGKTVIFEQTKLTESVAAKWYKVNHSSILSYLLAAYLFQKITKNVQIFLKSCPGLTNRKKNMPVLNM